MMTATLIEENKYFSTATVESIPNKEDLEKPNLLLSLLIMNYKYIAEKIKEGRKNLGLTQTELAKKIGISIRQMQYLESGEKMGLESTIEALKAVGYKLYLGKEIEEIK